MPKTTVVSTLPFVLTEKKPGQIPYEYVIPEADPNFGFSTLVVDDAVFLELIPLADERVPPRRVPILSSTVAKGLIDDYISANLAITYEPNHKGVIPIPGMFFLDGELSKADIIKNHQNLITQAVKSTSAWFERLVKIGDDDWQRFRQHKMITDLQRSAARYLNLEREWSTDLFEVLPSAICPSCATPVNPAAMICSSCRWILDKEKFENNKHNFAGAVIGR